MASSLCVLTSNLVTRSFDLPTIVSASRFRNIRFLRTIKTGRQSYSAMPKDDLYEQSWPRTLSPEISSMSFNMLITDEGVSLRTPEFSMYISELVETEDHEGVAIHLYLPTLNMKEMMACAEDNALFIKSPDKITGIDHIKEEMKNGMLEVTLPDKDTILANIIADIITSVQDIPAKRSWAYYDLFFDRSIIGKRLCPLLGMSVNSFSIYKEETSKRLNIDMNMPGNEYMKLTRQGIRLSLGMRGLERKDIRIFFDYNTMFIEGKGKEIHYITCIRLPEGIRKKHNMIRRQMENGTLYAFIPCCKKREAIKIDANPSLST